MKIPAYATYEGETYLVELFFEKRDGRVTAFVYSMEKTSIFEGLRGLPPVHDPTSIFFRRPALIPEGYQDRTGFHFGKPAGPGKEVVESR